MSDPDPGHLTVYCREVLPDMLTGACEVNPSLAQQIGADVLLRAEAFAALPSREQDVLIAPFLEEVFDHEPLDAPLALKAQVTVVVRNSLLEQAHHDGPVTSGIVPITRYAAAPLSHFLAARRTEPVDHRGPNPFAGLADRYPRAWACLTALTDVFAEGGRRPLTLPDAPVPQLPTGDEVATASVSSDGQAAVFSAIDPRFDQHLVGSLRRAAARKKVLCTAALSRYSRDSAKLHRILEYTLAHDVAILTTNHLIRPDEVWTRRGELVKPRSSDPYAGMAQQRGLTGAHRKVAETVMAQRTGA